MFYILMLLFLENENLSQEDGPEDKEPPLLATDQSSPEKDAWDIYNHSVESSFTDSSVVSGTWNTYVFFCTLTTTSQKINWGALMTLGSFKQRDKIWAFGDL